MKIHLKQFHEFMLPEQMTWYLQECVPGWYWETSKNVPPSPNHSMIINARLAYLHIPTPICQRISFPQPTVIKHCSSSAKCNLPIPPQLSLSLVLYMHFFHPPLPPSHPRSWNIPWKISEAHIFCELWLLALWLSETTDSTVQYR